jgi:arylsulfatase A-like enzyme
VPVLFWRKGGAPVAGETAVETTDIMPTLAAWLGVPLAPGSVDGHCISGVAECPGTAGRAERGKR